MGTANAKIDLRGLETVSDKVLGGTRLTYDDGATLFRHPNLHALGYLANIIRERKNGNRAYYIRNRHINYTNICKNRCLFCSFWRKPDAPDAYLLDQQAVKDKFRTHGGDYAEIHIVGGVNPAIPYSYYIELLRTVREACPSATIKAFTMVEIRQISEVSGKSVEETLVELRDNGLGMLPGGGAEIFSERLRKELFPNKIGPSEWLETARVCHRMGLTSNATMLYGHIETDEERVHHLMILRDLQDETGGFSAFVPLSYQRRNSVLHLPGPSAEMDLRMIAVSRLMLDNVDHIKAYWPFLTPKIAQIALLYGADDLDGTVVEEHIGHEAGAKTPQSLTPENLIHLIKEARREPVERNSLYEPT